MLMLDYLLMAPVARLCMLASFFVELLGMCSINTKHIFAT